MEQPYSRCSWSTLTIPETYGSMSVKDSGPALSAFPAVDVVLTQQRRISARSQGVWCFGLQQWCQVVMDAQISYSSRKLLSRWVLRMWICARSTAVVASSSSSSSKKASSTSSSKKVLWRVRQGRSPQQAAPRNSSRLWRLARSSAALLPPAPKDLHLCCQSKWERSWLYHTARSERTSQHLLSSSKWFYNTSVAYHDDLEPFSYISVVSTHHR